MGNNHTKLAQMTLMVFHSRTNAHINHLRTKSFAKHAALGAYYDAVVDLMDGIVENYQGLYGIVPTYPALYSPAADPIEDLDALRSWIAANRAGVSDDSSIQNQIDTVAELINSTIYKLKNLS